VSIIRTLAAAALALATLMPAASAQQATLVSTIAGADRNGPWGPSSYDFSLKVSKSIFKTINLQRTNKGLRPLTADPSLGLVAGSYAGDMLSGDFFGHFAPDGRDLQARLEEAGVRQFSEVAENLWTAEGEITWQYQETVRRAVLDWMNSREGHREAILDPNLVLAGVGTAIRDERIVVAMLFGRQ
jgi:uncharacterized protein YkwD